MIKFFGLLMLAGGGIMWLRIKYFNSSSRRSSKRAIKDLQEGKVDFAGMMETLSMMIRSKPVAAGFNLADFHQRLNLLTHKKLLGKITIQFVESKGPDTIVIGQAEVKDIVPGYYGTNDVKVVYPCWIHISVNTDEQRMDFRSTFPQDKEHQYLLEDMADEIFRQCTS